MVLPAAAEVRAQAFREQAEALAAARRLARRLASELGAVQVLLFGSRARDDWHMGSDCDVLVVSAAFEGMDAASRWNAIFDLWDGPVDIGPVGVTPTEFEQGRARAGIVAMALADGVVDLLD